jgi:hypothetical protein
MVTSSGDPAATTTGEPAASSSAPSNPYQPMPRISHIVRTYLDLSSS